MTTLSGENHSAADRLLVEVSNHLLESGIPGLISFAKLLHDLHRNDKTKKCSIAVQAVAICSIHYLKRPFVVICIEIVTDL